MAEVTVIGLDGVLDLLKKLPAEVVSKRGGPVRASLRKGAAVLHKQAVANLQAQLSQSVGEEATSTGLLLKNVVVTRGKPPSDSNGERYLVRVRRKPYGRKGAKVTTLKTAQIKEYGSVKQPAKPWLRPAFAAKAQEAIRTVEKSLVQSVNRIVKRLSKAKGSK